MTKRIFIPCDEWLYYKIYCGVKTADEILTDVILPLSKQMAADKIIDKWFFIRYSDPDLHIRVRFHFISILFIGNIMDELNQALKDYIESDKIWKVMIDTYQRELERYSNDSIVFAEDLFFADSICTATFLSLIEGDEGDKTRSMFAFRSIDTLLLDFVLTIKERMEFMEESKHAFGKEFNMNKSLKLQLDKKYREVNNDISFIMNLNKENANEYYPILELLIDRSIMNNRIVRGIKESPDFDRLKNKELLVSFVHMLMNRLFRSKQRMHELVIYDFMWRYYRSELAKAKYSFQNELRSEQSVAF